jgi:hypothetical protein
VEGIVASFVHHSRILELLNKNSHISFAGGGISMLV